MKKIDWTRPICHKKSGVGTLVGELQEDQEFRFLVKFGDNPNIRSFNQYGQTIGYTTGKRFKSLYNEKSPGVVEEAPKAPPKNPYVNMFLQQREDLKAIRALLEEVKAIVGPYKPGNWTPAQTQPSYPSSSRQGTLSGTVKAGYTGS